MYLSASLPLQHILRVLEQDLLAMEWYVVEPMGSSSNTFDADHSLFMPVLVGDKC